MYCVLDICIMFWIHVLCFRQTCYVLHLWATVPYEPLGINGAISICIAMTEKNNVPKLWSLGQALLVILPPILDFYISPSGYNKYIIYSLLVKYQFLLRELGPFLILAQCAL